MTSTDKYKLFGDIKTVALNYTGTIAVDDAVTLTANDEVGRGTAEAPVFGLVQAVGPGKATVQYGDFVVFNYSGTAPTAGANKELVVDGAGKVKIPATAGTGSRVDILAVDTANGKVAVRIK